MVSNLRMLPPPLATLSCSNPQVVNVSSLDHPLLSVNQLSVVVGSGDSEGLSQVGIARHIGDGVVKLCLVPNIVNIVVVLVS